MHDAGRTDANLAIRVHESTVRLALHARAYRLTTIQKSAYRFADRCTALVGPEREGQVTIVLHFAPGTAEATAIHVAQRFLRDLIDQELRETLAEETRAFRSLLLAQAFSRTDLLRRDK